MPMGHFVVVVIASGLAVRASYATLSLPGRPRPALPGEQKFPDLGN